MDEDSQSDDEDKEPVLKRRECVGCKQLLARAVISRPRMTSDKQSSLESTSCFSQCRTYAIPLALALTSHLSQLPCPSVAVCHHQFLDKNLFSQHSTPHREASEHEALPQVQGAHRSCRWEMQEQDSGWMAACVATRTSPKASRRAKVHACPMVCSFPSLRSSAACWACAGAQLQLTMR